MTLISTRINILVKTALMISFVVWALGITDMALAEGIIIPAYLPMTDATDWNILKEDAANFTRGTSSTYKDYYIVVTGPNSGPFTTPADWAKARKVWDPIVSYNGEIFGYVHTLASPTGTTFRPLAYVEKDVQAWVNGYGNLNGIWIDEFVPRYEIAGPTGSTATFPNGLALAPTDRSFLNPNGTFNASQVNPAGGYYSQLTQWIRARYPDLKIIGNAGGQFYSNQIKYAGLVDITCTVENTYAYAANSPVNNWANLIQQPGTAAYPQATLIHTNSVDLDGAIDQPIGHGFKYFFTTNRTPSGNIWGGLPSYFTTEVNYIANHN